VHIYLNQLQTFWQSLPYATCAYYHVLCELTGEYPSSNHPKLAGWWFSMRHMHGARECSFDQDTVHIHTTPASNMLMELTIYNPCLLARAVQAGREPARRTITELRNLEGKLSSGTLQTS
jgi:hypothetical protein